MLLGQELKFKNKLCNLKLGTFFSALPGLGTLGPSARSMVTIIYIISFFPISLSRGLKSLFTEFSAIFC